MTPLWHWAICDPYVLLPWETRRNSRGEVLSTKERARWALTREKRREEQNRRILDLYADDDAGYLARIARVRATRRSLASASARATESIGGGERSRDSVGGPIAWNYLTPRVDRMWRRGEITTDEMKASISFCYWAQIGWLMHAPPTNMVKHEKVDGGRKSYGVRSGATFPIHKMLREEVAVLEAALIRDVPFKELPMACGESRITRHRTGRQAFLSALSAFDRLIKTVLTR